MKCLYLVTRSLDPHRDRTRQVDDAVEASHRRIRHHVQWPLAGSRNLLTELPETPITG
jgi:hypothetical protein